MLRLAGGRTLRAAPPARACLPRAASPLRAPATFHAAPRRTGRGAAAGAISLSRIFSGHPANGIMLFARALIRATSSIGDLLFCCRFRTGRSYRHLAFPPSSLFRSRLLVEHFKRVCAPLKLRHGCATQQAARYLSSNKTTLSTIKCRRRVAAVRRRRPFSHHACAPGRPGDCVLLVRRFLGRFSASAGILLL